MPPRSLVFALLLGGCSSLHPRLASTHAAPPASADRGATATMSPAQIAEQAFPSVTLIRLPGGGVGSGFVVGRDGVIATNLHVVNGARSVTVVLSDGREFHDVRVTATDDAHDLALLKIEAQDLPVLVLGDSAHVRAGTRVVAIGHPLGLGNTISDGLVSGVREVSPGVDVLQVSAPISPGSSGGPLFDEAGRVIGISTLIMTKGQNLNFGVGVNALKSLIADPAHGVVRAAAGGGSMAGIVRDVPHHKLTVLAGCRPAQLASVVERISSAISVGAPLYNQGNHEACYRIYAATARDIEREGICPGPTKALVAGLKRADGLANHTAKAWAMRDAFDGLLEVIERKDGGGPSPTAVDHAPVREVPTHPLSLLAGCSSEELSKLNASIGQAIETGAPLYNDGNHEACYRIYEGTALDLDRLHGCAGPRHALMNGVRKARGQDNYTDKAWSMRDAFDGVLDVISRRARAN